MGVNHSQDRTHADPAPGQSLQIMQADDPRTARQCAETVLPDADAPLDKNAQPLEVVSLLRSSDGYSRRCGLLKVAQAGRRQLEGSAWAAPYLEAGVIEALVEVTARAQQHEIHEQVRASLGLYLLIFGVDVPS